MCASRWQERREAYLLERGRWADLVREGYVEHGLTLIDGGRCRREREQSPALLVIAAAPTCEAQKGKEVQARDLRCRLRDGVETVGAGPGRDQPATKDASRISDSMQTGLHAHLYMTNDEEE